MWMFDQDKRQDRRDVADLKELLKAQLRALGEGRYELTLRTRDDQVSYAHVSAADILDRVRDLRAVNMAGTDVASDRPRAPAWCCCATCRRRASPTCGRTASRRCC